MPDKGFAIQPFSPNVHGMQKNLSSPYQPPGVLSIVKRLVNFLMAASVASLVLYLWLNNVLSDQQQAQRQAMQLGTTISAQNAKLLAHALQRADTEMMQTQLQILQQDPQVHSVALFDAYGQKVMASEQDNAIVDLFDSDQHPALMVFVEDVFHQQTHLGFLRVTLWQERVLKYYHAYQQELILQAGLLMILSLLCGILLTRGYYKVFTRHPKTNA